MHCGIHAQRIPPILWWKNVCPPPQISSWASKCSNNAFKRQGVLGDGDESAELHQLEKALRMLQRAWSQVSRGKSPWHICEHLYEMAPGFPRGRMVHVTRQAGFEEASPMHSCAMRIHLRLQNSFVISLAIFRQHTLQDVKAHPNAGWCRQALKINSASTTILTCVRGRLAAKDQPSARRRQGDPS